MTEPAIATHDDARPLTEADVRTIVREEIERAFKKDPANKKLCIIASVGRSA